MALINLAEKQYHWSFFSNGFGKNAIQERIVAIMKFKKATYISVGCAVLLLVGAITVFAQNDSKTANTDYNDSYGDSEGIDASASSGFLTENTVREEIQNWPEFKVNEDGLTHSPEMFESDLIWVCTDQGKDGYVYRTDLEKFIFADVYTTEEALEWQAELEEKYPDGIPLTAYKSDGKTIVGTFTLKSN